MINVSIWTDKFLQALNSVFGNRVWFVGLQGSYARGEATESSDIDTVVILDELSSADIQAYNDMLDTLPQRERLCGFLSGKNELLSWEPSDLFQFYHDTKPIWGTLDALLPLLDAVAIQRAVKIGACNIYHGCVHNMLYDKSEEILRGLYKSATFVIRATVFLQTGAYRGSLTDLIQGASAQDKIIIDTFEHFKSGALVDFSKASSLLFEWSKKQIEKWDKA